MKLKSAVITNNEKSSGSFLSAYRTQALLLIFVVLMILPFIILFAFNHPSADDFGTELAKKFGFITSQVNSYHRWSGKILSNAILAISPVYFKSIIGYKLFTLAIMLVFIYVLYLFVSEFTKSILNARERWLISLSVFFLFLYGMPSIAQSFYWITGTVVYMMSIIFIMIFLIGYSRLNYSKDNFSKTSTIILCAIMLFATAISSEIAMALMLMVVPLIIIIHLLSKKKLNLPLIIFLLAIGIGSLIVVTAPGNHARQELFPTSRNAVLSFYTTFQLLLPKLFSWIFLTPLIPVTLLLLPVLSKLFGSNEKMLPILSVNPVYSLIILFLLLYGTTYVPVWSLGKEPYNRNWNLVYFLFLIGWFFNVISAGTYLKLKYKFSFERIPAYVTVLAFVVMAAFLFTKNNVRLAYTDLLRGTAYKYNQELNDRYDYISQSKLDTVEVPALKFVPRTLYVCDIFEDPESDLNKLYAYYFGKSSVYVKKEDAP